MWRTLADLQDQTLKLGGKRTLTVADGLQNLMRGFVIRIQRCSVSLEMSNKIALVSLDFAATGSVCGGNKRSCRPWTRN
jgi:hypothetical protein